MRLFRSVCVVLALAVLLSGAAAPTSPVAQGQSIGVTWSRPVKLSGELASVPHPTVATDAAGNVYAFWSQGLNGHNPANLIYFSYSSGQAWADPYDLFAGPEGVTYDFPYAIVDASGRIHLTWAGSDGLYYSSAPVASARDVKAWSPPQLLVPASVVAESRLGVDQDGALHVVFSQRAPGTNIRYLRSDDGGQSWTAPIAVSELIPGDAPVPDMTRLVIDSHGSLHLVWSENWPPEYVSRHVYYARSEDHGSSWTRPIDLSDQTSDRDWDASINIAVDKQDQLHVVWTCGVSPGRCYRNSRDGGNSWSSIQHIFNGLIGLSGWDMLGADPYGNVYWVGSLRPPNAFYFSQFGAGRWTDPPQQLISLQESEGLAQAHYPQLVVAQGNQLHVVMIEGDHGAVWYVHGQTTLPALPSAALPTPVSSPMGGPVSLPTASGAGHPAPTEKPPVVSDIRTDSSGPPVVVWAIVPVLALLVAVIVMTSLRSRH